jgi:hypothetical protein
MRISEGQMDMKFAANQAEKYQPQQGAVRRATAEIARHLVTIDGLAETFLMGAAQFP